MYCLICVTLCLDGSEAFFYQEVKLSPAEKNDSFIQVTYALSCHRRRPLMSSRVKLIYIRANHNVYKDWYKTINRLVKCKLLTRMLPLISNWWDVKGDHDQRSKARLGYTESAQSAEFFSLAPSGRNLLEKIDIENVEKLPAVARTLLVTVLSLSVEMVDVCCE